MEAVIDQKMAYLAQKKFFGGSSCPKNGLLSQQKIWRQ